MTRIMGRPIALVTMLVLLTSLLGSQDTVQDFSQVLEELGASVTYDPLLEILTVRRGADTLAIGQGQDWGIWNGKIKKRLPGFLFDKGGITINALGRESLRELFVPQGNTDDRRRITTIFIDPGHGGKDPGALGTKGTGAQALTIREKDVVLKASLFLRDLLRRNFPDIRIVLSRETDVFLSLEERTRKANSYARSKDQSVLYLSLHVNASLNSRARGFEVWHLPPETRRQIVMPGDYQVDSSILPILNTLREEEISVESYLMADSILKGIQTAVGGLSQSRGLKQEEWFVVRNAFMPSVLLELGFLSNPEELDLLASDDYLKKLAQGIYSGVASFITSYQAVQKQ